MTLTTAPVRDLMAGDCVLIGFFGKTIVAWVTRLSRKPGARTGVTCTPDGSTTASVTIWAAEHDTVTRIAA